MFASSRIPVFHLHIASVTNFSQIFYFISTAEPFDKITLYTKIVHGDTEKNVNISFINNFAWAMDICRYEAMITGGLQIYRNKPKSFSGLDCASSNYVAWN